MPTWWLSNVGYVVLPSGMLPNYHPFCCVILLWLVITLELFVHLRVECVLRYSRWLIFVSSVLTLNVASNWGRHLRRLMKWWKTFMVISAWTVHVFRNGLSDFRMIGGQHMMSCIWDGPQRHVTTLMLRKFVKSCVLIIVWQCGK
jgi:hypothetical protein